MKGNEQSIENCLKKYSEHHCILTKKKDTAFAMSLAGAEGLEDCAHCINK